MLDIVDNRRVDKKKKKKEKVHTFIDITYFSSCCMIQQIIYLYYNNINLMVKYNNITQYLTSYFTNYNFQM